MPAPYTGFASPLRPTALTWRRLHAGLRLRSAPESLDTAWRACPPTVVAGQQAWGMAPLMLIFVRGSAASAHSGKYNPATGAIEHPSTSSGQAVPAALVAITAVKYTGQEYDPETGFYYYNARYYDPQLGVFTTSDDRVPGGPKELFTTKASVGGGALDYFPAKSQTYVSLSQAFNRHMYVTGNPIKYTDPTGHEPFITTLIAIGIMGLLPSGLSLAFNEATQPPWHNYTGKDRKTDAFAPVTVLDTIAYTHDMWFGVKPFQTGNSPINDIIGDALFISLYAASVVTGAIVYLNIGFGIAAVWKDLSKNCNGKALCYIGAALGTALFGPLMGLFFAGTDLIVGAIGTVLFSFNILYNTGRLIYNIGKDIHATTKDLSQTISQVSFKNIFNPSKWKIPEGEGRFKNWYRPWKWCFKWSGC